MNEKKISKEFIAHDDIVEYVKEYINLQKPGLLNLKPFKSHKPDIMTVKYIDTLVDQFRIRVEKIELERKERVKKQ